MNLSVANGSLTLSGTTGITFLDGTSNSSNYLSLSGAETDINAALEGLQYTPDTNYNGADTLTVEMGSLPATEAAIYAEYEFENGATTDSSGNGRDGSSTVGTPSLTVDAERGDVLTFDGTERIHVANGTSGLGEVVTITAWVNLDAGQSDNIFLSLGDEVYLVLDPTNTSYGIGAVVGSFGSNSLDPSIRVAGTGWRHVALTLDDTNNRLSVYVDGVLERSSNYSGMDADWATAASQDIILGSLSDGSRAFHGSMDDVRVYASELSQSEIISVMGDQGGYDQRSVGITVNAVNDAPYFSDRTNAADIRVDLNDVASVTSADFDNDGDVDLVATTDTGGLYWFENDGTGTFGAANLIASAQNFTAVKTYDLEGDGDLDIVATNNDPADAADSVFVLTNQFIGSGSVSFTTTSFEGSVGGESDGGQDLAIGDIDGDGRADIAATFYRSIGDSQVVVFEQNSVGVWTKSFSDSVNNAYGIELADMDGDFDLDIVAGDFQDKEIRWYENDGGATAGFTRQTIYSDSDLFVFDIAIGDFNGDMVNDIAFVDWGGTDEVAILTNDGTSNPSFQYQRVADGFSLLYHVEAADLDGDGFDDLIVVDRSQFDIVAFQNDGTGNFTRQIVDDNTGQVEWTETADVDGDGNLDIITASHSFNDIVIHKNYGDGFLVANPLEDISYGGIHIEVADDDAGGNLLEVTINVVNGRITLPTGSINILSGGSGTSSITFEGTVSNINAALNSFTFSPDADFVGLAEVQVTVDDRGNTGGTAKTAAETLYFDVQPMPDPLTDAHYTTWIGDSEFIVNTETTNSQDSPGVTALADGGFVVVWESNGQDTDNEGVYFQRYDAAGNAIGSETPVNTTVANSQDGPEVTALANGGFVVVWESAGQDTDQEGVFLRVFDADGVAVSAEVPVNTTTADYQDTPEIATLTGGGFVVVWESLGQDSDGDGIYFQRFDDAGVAQGIETRANVTTSGTQGDPRVTGTNDGGFVVAWEDNSSGNNEVVARRFDASGTAASGEIAVNTETTNSQDDAVVQALTGGGFVAVWESVDQDGDGNGIFGQRFDAAGAAVGGEFQVNSSITGNQQDQRVQSLADGGFMVIWESGGDQDGNETGVFAQQFDAAGNKVNGEIQINTTTAANQANSDVAILNDGRMVAVWDADVQDGDNDAVVGRIFSPALNENSPAGTVAAVVSQVVDPDVGDVYTYSLTDDAGGAFDIQADGTIVVLDPSLIDFENTTSLNVTVRITDPVAGTHDEVVTIYLNNLAEAEHTVPGAQTVAEDGVANFQHRQR